jgi:hypothetical protein
LEVGGDGSAGAAHRRGVVKVALRAFEHGVEPCVHGGLRHHPLAVLGPHGARSLCKIPAATEAAAKGNQRAKEQMGGGIGRNHDRGRQGWGDRRKARIFSGGDGNWIPPRISTVRSKQEGQQCW